MTKYITLKGLYSKRDFSFELKALGKGSQKIVYLTRDKRYVVGIYKNDLDQNSKERLKDIIEFYRRGIFETDGKDYWKKTIAWPVDLVQTKQGKWGVVMPALPDRFRFNNGPLKGKEKKGSWFIYQNAIPMVQKSELGNWKKFLDISLHISRSIRRLHAAGLSHSDLSFNNIIVDPQSGFAHIIDLDNLVVPGKYPPDVIGTPGFIAPEVLKTIKNKTNRALPSIETDLHALAVMIYMFLFHRHPLEGRKVWDNDGEKDEVLQKGEKALFIEDSRSKINRIKNPKENFPWSDLSRLPYSIAGPYLAPLFKKAFEDGLHNPKVRPLAAEWESALIKTQDISVKCANPKCSQKWFVFNRKGKCPFCGSKLGKDWPVINLNRFDKKKQEYIFDNRQIIPFDGKKIYSWQCKSDVHLNEKLDANSLKSTGFFQFYKGSWYLVPASDKRSEIQDTSKGKNPEKKYYKINNNMMIKMGSESTARGFGFKIITF